jgi:hypothetical protein
MKNLFYFIFVLLLISCKKEKSNPTSTCNVSDFLGVWKVVGGKACANSDFNALTITDLDSNKVNVVYEGDGIIGLDLVYDIDGCSMVKYDIQPALDISLVAKGTLKDGQLQIARTGIVFGNPVDCTETLTR